MARKPAKKAIALALGVGPSRVSHMIKAGMPVHSIEAAACWYRDNVRPRLNPKPRKAQGDPASGPDQELLQAFRQVATSWLQYAAWLNAFYQAMNPDDPATEAAFDRAAAAAFKADPADLVQGIAEWDLSLIVEHDPNSDLGKAAREALAKFNQKSQAEGID